jgi:hypothetical protein
VGSDLPIIGEVGATEGWGDITQPTLPGPPAPHTLYLDIWNTFTQGDPLDIVVTGPSLVEGARVALFIGTNDGNGQCFPNGACLEVSDIVFQSQRFAAIPPDDTGWSWDTGPSLPEASWNSTMPSGVADGTYYVQALHINGADTQASDVLSFTVDSCASGSIRSQADVDRVEDCTSLPSLSFQDTFSGSATFPNLETVGSIGRCCLPQTVPALTELHLPVLTEVTASINLADIPTLTTFVAPMLERNGVGWSIDLRSPITTLDLTSLEFTGYDFDLPTTLTSLELPNYTTADSGVNFSGMTSLTTLTLPSLTEARYLDVVDNPVLTSFSAPNFVYGSLQVRRNDSITVIDVPQFAELRHQLDVVDNTSLVELNLPSSLVDTGCPGGSCNVSMFNNGSWCYDGPMDFTLVDANANVDECAP